MEKRNSFYAKYIKRLLDFIIGIIAVCIFSLPMLIIATIILVSEGRPIIFKQSRVGQRKKPFTIYKFRTMINGASNIGPSYTCKNDTRITRLGKILRKTSLDELPQLFNVIKGDMSCIGYRPDVVCSNDPFESEKYEMKPGITGYAQVNGRSSLSSQEVLEWELKYVKDVSFYVDIKIIIKTIGLVLKRDNTN